MNRKLLLILTFAIIFSLWTNQAQAGFGISPPYVKSDKILPGSHYEQKINLLRSSAEEDLKAEISINAPEISSWISIDKGETFNLPKGELRVPMIVRVDVPSDAAIGRYTGYINARIAPASDTKGGVAIALGARIDIDLNVTKDTFPDFLIRSISIPDLEELKAPWNWPVFSWLFYRIKIGMNIENTGNVKIAPSKVHLDVWDLNEKVLLQANDDKSIEKIDPFEVKTVVATFPTKLKAGQYWGKIKIYKNEEIVRDDKVAFTIVPPGSLPGGTKLGPWPWLMLFGLIILALFIIWVLIKVKIWKYIFKMIYFICRPLIFIGKKIGALFKGLKYKFWRWMHKKASNYSDEIEFNKKK